MVVKKKNEVDLQAQIEALQQQVLDLSSRQETHSTFDAMEQIDKVGRVDSDKILLVEKHDHKNISLWTKDGKRIGPLHPHNAKQTLIRFKKLKGIDLLVNQPSKEQIERYKTTDEYKNNQALFKKMRDIKEKSRGSKNMERYGLMIAKELGKTVAEINQIKRPQEVGK